MSEPCPVCTLVVAGECPVPVMRASGKCPAAPGIDVGPAEPSMAKKAKEAKKVPPDDPGAFDTLAGEKSEESEKRVSVPPPVADPAMYQGILGDITVAAAPTTEADPAGIHASLLAGAGVRPAGPVRPDRQRPPPAADLGVADRPDRHRP